jgi:transcriptional regulator with XRE-family HTH domain
MLNGNMTKDELKHIRERLGLTSHQQMANLLKIKRVVYTRYENGTRKVPAYIEQSLNFFLSLSKRAQERFLKQARRSAP